MLKPYFDKQNAYEVGIDEAGRGPLFGRVYSAAVVLPNDNSFRHELMKDSKTFTSSKKLNEVADYIKTNAISYSICFEEPEIIDSMNILNATIKSMHKCVKNINIKPDILLVDGTYFKSYCMFNEETGIECIPHVCIPSGDAKYSSIAAASILAKSERDFYVDMLCEVYPELHTKYGLKNNKGYGTKQHFEGIEKYGITKWHRKSFKPCIHYESISEL
jgi:ribonuclease HII